MEDMWGVYHDSRGRVRLGCAWGYSQHSKVYQFVLWNDGDEMMLCREDARRCKDCDSYPKSITQIGKTMLCGPCLRKRFENHQEIE